VCDLSYAIQREEIVARALAEMQLAPHMKEPESITPPDVAVDLFDKWLDGQPADPKPFGEMELEQLLGIGGR
jgi:hypothetical protein